MVGKPPAFLSTLSLRRATEQTAREQAIAAISIHALLAESDGCGHVTVGHQKQFLSTLSLRRATAPTFIVYSITDISIHALLAESDR